MQGFKLGGGVGAKAGFGAGAKSAMSMITESKKADEQRREFKAPLDKLTSMTNNPDQLLEALKLCFSQQSFKSQFYNLTANDQFEQVTCASYTDLHKKADFQIKSLDECSQMMMILNQQTEKIDQQRQLNLRQLAEISQRQLAINLAIVQALGNADQKVEPTPQQATRLKELFGITVESGNFNGAALREFLDQQAAVLVRIVEFLQQKVQ